MSYSNIKFENIFDLFFFNFEKICLAEESCDNLANFKDSLISFIYMITYDPLKL